MPRHHVQAKWWEGNGADAETGLAQLTCEARCLKLLDFGVQFLSNCKKVLDTLVQQPVCMQDLQGPGAVSACS